MLAALETLTLTGTALQTVGTRTAHTLRTQHVNSPLSMLLTCMLSDMLLPVKICCCAIL